MKFDAKSVSILLVLVVVGALAYTALTTRENRTVGQRVDAAVEQLDDGGIDDAARELKDRTPAERIRDEVNDATDKND